MIEQDLRTALMAHAPLAALVGENVSAVVAPEGCQPPYVVFQLVAGQRPASMSRPGSTVNKRMQITCFARSYSQVKAIAQAVQDAVEASPLFAAAFQGDQDLYDPETKLRYVALDYSLWQ